jgi:hypothetical protein
MVEVQRWIRVVGCEVIALQECESAMGFPELLGSHELVGAVQYIHVPRHTLRQGPTLPLYPSLPTV